MRSRVSTFVYFVVALAIVIASLLGSQHDLAASSSHRPQQQSIPLAIRIELNLERPNSPPPSAPWVVPITLSFHQPGNPTAVSTYTGLMLDEYGVYFGGIVLQPGVYDVKVKNFHTLQNVKRNVDVGLDTTVNMGTLLEGDAYEDNRVYSSDFTLLRNAYFTVEGDAAFDPRTDFDEDNMVRSSDFALLRNNYFKAGDIVVGAPPAVGAPPLVAPPLAAAGKVDLALEPATVKAAVGETFVLTLMAHAGTQPFATFDADIRFPPGVLQAVGADGAAVTEIEPLAPVDNVIINKANNTTGRILYGAGVDFGADPVSGDVALAKVRFMVLAKGTGVAVSIPDATVADTTGKWVTGTASGTAVQVAGAGWQLFLPVVLR